MPQLVGTTYGNIRKEKGSARESIDTVMKDGVLEANGIRKTVVNVEISRKI